MPRTWGSLLLKVHGAGNIMDRPHRPDEKPDQTPVCPGTVGECDEEDGPRVVFPGQRTQISTITSGCMQNTVRFKSKPRIKQFSVCFRNHGLMLAVKRRGRSLFELDGTMSEIR